MTFCRIVLLTGQLSWYRVQLCYSTIKANKRQFRAFVRSSIKHVNSAINLFLYAIISCHNHFHNNIFKYCCGIKNHFMQLNFLCVFSGFHDFLIIKHAKCIKINYNLTIPCFHVIYFILFCVPLMEMIYVWKPSQYIFDYMQWGRV